MKENHIFPFLWMRGESPEILRTEMQKIYDSGIRAVCLEARPHPDYAGELWWHDVDIIIDEAKKLNMQIWILDDAHFPTGMANNCMKKYPERVRRFFYSQFVDVTGPLPEAQVDINLLMTKQVTWMDIGKKNTPPLFDETKLLSVTAAKISQGDLLDGSPLDLTEKVTDGYLTTDIPDGTWRIFVNFSTTAIGAKPDYINYVEHDSVQILIDEVYEKHYERYKDLFGTTIVGFFSDEPGFYNTDTYDENNYIGYYMPLPWGKETERCLKEKYGSSLYQDLPFLYATEKDGKQRALRAIYMDVISNLYSKNFCCQIGNWCRKHGVKYIGHIAEDSYGHKRMGSGAGHYFRAMAGQDMAGIDNIGYQIMPGNDIANRHTGFQDLIPDFYHYQLGKLGSSDAAIDPKKKGRLMCENFGAYGWRLGVRDMKWLADYLIGQGTNYFVPHAFSMAKYPDDDCPPHFYARGKNPQYPYFCHLMKYIDRLCNLFSDGQNVPQAAILYEAESEWAGNAMHGFSIGKELLRHQIDFEFVPSDVFDHKEYYGCMVENGNLIINNRSMKVLIIPECDFIPGKAAKFIAENPDLFVLYINRLPIGIIENVKNADDLFAAATQGKAICSLDQLSNTLLSKNIHDEVYSDIYEKNLQLYHYKKGGRDFYHLMNTSLSETVNVLLHLPENSYGYYNALTDTTTAVEITDNLTQLILPPYGSTVLLTNPTKVLPPEKKTVYSETIILDTFDIELFEIDHPVKKESNVFPLKSISSLNRDFSGTVQYKTSVYLNELPEKVVFHAQYVFECMTITLNGTEFPVLLTPPYEVDLSSALKKGENELTVSVTSTAIRNANTKPGMFGKERAVLEPVGMFGKVELNLYHAL